MVQSKTTTLNQTLVARDRLARPTKARPARDTEVDQCIDEMILNRTRYSLDTVQGRMLHELVKKYISYENLRSIVADWRRCQSGMAMINSMHQLVSPRVSAYGLENVPDTGGCLLIANHPTGLTDGVALFDRVSTVRRDVSIYVFHELLTINEKAGDSLIPVDWRPGQQDRDVLRQTLTLTRQAFEADELVTIFPSGRLSYWNGIGLKERPWRSSFIGMARKFGVPLVPVHIRGRNSLLYYALTQISTDLREVQSIREIQNKRHARYHLTIGPTIPCDALSGDPDKLANDLQRYVETELPVSPEERWAA